MKITVIGGGGVRSMFLAKSLVQSAKKLKISKIVFMDNNEEKLNVFGKMAKQVAKRIDNDIEFDLTTDPIEAIKDADHVITTIRVGGDKMRIRDEKIALSHNLIGQETTGAAGFSFAMRSIPPLAQYCELTKKYAKKDAKVFNFTNPVGVVSQTLRDMGYDFTYGICDAPSGLLHSFAKLYDVPQDDITGDCYGLNHLSFFNSIKLKDKEIMPDLLIDPRVYEETDMKFFEPELGQQLGCILNEYLYYYFYREKAIENMKNAEYTRGEYIDYTSKKMMEELSGMDIENDFDNCLKIFEKWYGKRENAYMANETGKRRKQREYKFDIYEQEQGGYAGVALKYIEAQQTGKPVKMILCVPNDGAIPGLKDEDVVEITCNITSDGCEAIKIEEPNEIAMEMIHRVKTYERIASQALINKSIDKAIDCLMLHPLVNSYSLAKKLIKEYLISNEQYIKEWS